MLMKICSIMEQELRNTQMGALTYCIVRVSSDDKTAGHPVLVVPKEFFSL